MERSGEERRKHKRFRILYIDFNGFWNRFILRKPSSGSPSPRPREEAKPLRTQVPMPPLAPPRPHGTRSGLDRVHVQPHDIRSAVLALQKEIKNGLTGPPLVEALERLLAQVNAQFQKEEADREQRGHPSLQARREEHEQFRINLVNMEDRITAGDATVLLELVAFLFNWLRERSLQQET